MIEWILILVLNTNSNQFYLREPMLIDSFQTREQCLYALDKLTREGIGNGNCWGEGKE
jgi:hypothetical protein